MTRYFIIVALFIFQYSTSQTILGKWKTVDDATGEEKSIVEIYKKDGKVFGKIIEIFDASKRDLPCNFCKGDDYNQPVLGLEIIKNMEKVGDAYKKGSITNPEDGKVYDCRLKLDESNSNKLQVRGYVAFFYRTQYWIRAN
ncbi:DUF2147 domain-containing protein [Psychroserpens sp. SPM9]|uniref:DUF2147 domain-containing protein n=1 Tax=Psychroserpens sp. SPM9 TaxID=2975598 RepID=UPI0021A5A070|nr:DUF2147 domain-containing protein [Psychroserpens sp. SPM9]MDG5492336.1 DUF2147 domain-containing protein [Psychroserpens sp. SPM9]